MNDAIRRLAERLFVEMFDATGIMRAAASIDVATQAAHVEHVGRLARIALLSADAFDKICDEFDDARGEAAVKSKRTVREVAYLDAGREE